jgi:hexosaminidase
MKGSVMSNSYHTNKATNASVFFKEAPHKSYSTGGGFTLVNAETASIPRINEQWLGWNGNDMEATIKFENEEKVHEIEAGFLDDQLSWIYFPERVDFFASTDGISYHSLGKGNIDLTNGNRFVKLTCNPVNIRYIKIIAKNRRKIPGGKPGAGENAWLFCDEIIIR